MFSLGASCNGQYYVCPHLKANTCTWKKSDGQNSLLEVPYCLKMAAQNQLAAVSASHLVHASDIGMLDVDPCWHFIFGIHIALILHISFVILCFSWLFHHLSDVSRAVLGIAFLVLLFCEVL